MFGTLVLALLIFKTTLQHYVSPPSACLLSKFCNHTWVPECGQESAKKNIRMFLDLCDMHEYNCEQTNDYHKVDFKECPQDSTTMSTTDTTSNTTTGNNVSIDTTAFTTTTVATIKPSSESSAKPENVTTINTETSTLSTTITSISTESTAKFCSCDYTKSTELTSTTEPPTTYSSIATTLPSSETKTSTETTTLSTVLTNKDVDVPQTTIDDYEATEAESYATIVEDIETETYQTEAPTSPSAPLVTCSSYPEHCDVPSTWETTAKGETRDFFQILRERFGDRVRILRATTHWPRRVLVNNQQSAFLNGRHWDSQIK